MDATKEQMPPLEQPDAQPEQEEAQDQTPEQTTDETPQEPAEKEPDESPETPQEVAESPEAPAEAPDQEEIPQEMEALDLVYPAPPKKKFTLRAELVMGIIALLAGALLLAMVVLCQPYFSAREEVSEDPEALPQFHDEAATQPPEELLEPTTPETEPENPTIPPERNPYDRYDFQYDRNNYLLLQNLPSSPGIDVSAYQGRIDWEAVAASGIEFAFIRLGYRGYGTGRLVEDDYAQRNLKGAADAGLKVGAYFFSQALNTREVDEEITFMLHVLGSNQLDIPIVLDWEIPTADARTAGMDARTLTDIQLHFCQEMERRGFEPMVYFNWHQSENLYYLSELEDYPFWLALYQDRMTYPWKVEYWQYSDHGRVPGISGDVDLNVYMPD